MEWLASQPEWAKITLSLVTCIMMVGSVLGFFGVFMPWWEDRNDG